MWNSLASHGLLRSKSEKCSLGKFQHPIQCMKRTLHLYGLKSYFMNVAALPLGLKGIDRKLAPAPVEGSMEEISVDGKATLKQHAHQSWNMAAHNQLDRAAWLFGNCDNYFKQKLVCNVVAPTSEWHSRWPWVKFVTLLALVNISI